jgi:HK97 family phage major capsid protein
MAEEKNEAIDSAKALEELTAKFLEDKKTYNEQVKSLQEAELKNADNVESLRKTVADLEENLVKAQSVMLKQGEALQKINFTEKKDGVKKTIIEKFQDAFTEAGEKVEQFKKGEISGLNLEVKDYYSTKGTVDIDDLQNSTISMQLGGFGKKPVRNTVIAGLFNNQAVTNPSRGEITYTDQDTLARNAATVARCTAVPESDINWIEQSCTIQKIGDSIPICREAIEDVPAVEAEVRNFLLENVALEEDNQYLLGDGTGNNLKGVDSVAPNWAAGTFALAVPTPSVYDVISTGVTQIKVAGEGSFYQPNWTLMHPDDVEEMRLTKDANGNYIIPPFADLSTFSIRGTKIIESTLVPQNQMYIGDFSFGTVYTSRNLMLEIANQHGTDFLSDILRMKATSRKALVIRNVHAGAFLHVASISQAITDLTKP